MSTHRRAEKCLQSWESPSSVCSRRKAARLLNGLPSTRLRFNKFFNVIAGTVIVTRCGERNLFSLPVSLLISDEAFICNSPIPKSISTLPQKIRKQSVFMPTTKSNSFTKKLAGGAKAEHGFKVPEWIPSAKDCLKVCSLR